MRVGRHIVSGRVSVGTAHEEYGVFRHEAEALFEQGGACPATAAQVTKSNAAIDDANWTTSPLMRVYPLAHIDPNCRPRSL